MEYSNINCFEELDYNIGKKITSDEIVKVYSKIVVVRKQNSFGIINIDKRVLTQTSQYDKLYTNIPKFNNGYAIVSIKNGDTTLYGVINEDGEEVVETIYLSIKIYDDGLIQCQLPNDKYEIIYPDGTKDSGYGTILERVNEEIFIKKEGATYLINKYERKSDYYEKLTKISDNFVKYKKGKKYGILKSKGGQLTSAKYLDIQYNQKYNVFQVQKTKRHGKGLIDSEGNELIPCKYDQILILSYNRVLAIKKPSELSDTYQILDFNNNIIKDKTKTYGNRKLYDNYAVFGHDYKVISSDGSEKYLDCYYLSFDRFHHGKVIAKNRDYQYGILSKDNELLVDYKYDDAEYLGNGIFNLSDADEKSAFYKNGILTDCIYDDWEYKNGVLIVKSGDYFGLYNSDLLEVLKLCYDAIEFITDNLIRIKKGDKYGLVDNNGNILLDTQYPYFNSASVKGNLISINNGTNYFLITKGGQILIYNKPFKSMHIVNDSYIIVNNCLTYLDYDKIKYYCSYTDGKNKYSQVFDSEEKRKSYIQNLKIGKTFGIIDLDLNNLDSKKKLLLELKMMVQDIQDESQKAIDSIKKMTERQTNYLNTMINQLEDSDIKKPKQK